MKIYGLTGGIASGKSTVASILREHGFTVVDADEVARAVVAPGTQALAEIGERWPQVISPDGTLDRKALGDIVFNDPGARRALEAITHPRIAAESGRLLQEAAARNEPLAFYEAALLVENQLAGGFDGLLVVSVPEDVQLARLRARDGLDEAAARARIAAQLPLSEKAKQATHVIDNSGSREETRQSTETLIGSLLAGTDSSGGTTQ